MADLISWALAFRMAPSSLVALPPLLNSGKEDCGNLILLGFLLSTNMP